MILGNRTKELLKVQLLNKDAKQLVELDIKPMRDFSLGELEKGDILIISSESKCATIEMLCGEMWWKNTDLGFDRCTKIESNSFKFTETTGSDNRKRNLIGMNVKIA